MKSKDCGRVLEKNLRSCLTNDYMVLQRFFLWHTNHPEPFSIYESWGVLWKEPNMSVLTVLEELQAPKPWWVPCPDFLFLWQEGMQQPCLPGLESQDGNCEGQATATSWCPAVRVQNSTPEVHNCAPSGLFCWSAVSLPPALFSCQNCISFLGNWNILGRETENFACDLKLLYKNCWKTYHT